MIQILFVGIFVSVLLPVLWSLGRNRHAVEGKIANWDRVGGVLMAVLLGGLGLSQFLRTGGYQLESAPWTQLNLINSAVLETLVGTPTHELGHFLFMPFGQTLMILGGSFFQLFLPVALSVWFFVSDCRRLSSIFLLLLGHSMFHVAWYMSSASHPDQITLLSLEQGAANHDWFRLFSQWGVLSYDTKIAAVVRFGASVTTLFALGYLLTLQWVGDLKSSEYSK